MKEIEFKFRDLIAAPFWLLASLLEAAAVSIGGAWTASLVLKVNAKHFNPTSDEKT